MTELLHSTHVWYAISFVLFAVFAIAMGRKKVAQMLDDRIESIKNELGTAESLRVEAQELLAGYQKKHVAAMKDAETIIEQAKEQAANITQQADADLEATLKRREAQLEDKIKRLEENAVHEIQAQAAELAIAATEKLIRDNVDKNVDSALVKDTISSISQKLH